MSDPDLITTINNDGSIGIACSRCTWRTTIKGKPIVLFPQHKCTDIPAIPVKEAS